MNRKTKISIFLVLGIALILIPAIVKAGPFLGYSLKAAEAQIQQAGHAETQLMELGGITRIAGLIHDVQRKDFIIVGQANQGEPKITLDDFVVATRALHVNGQWPFVSIDKTPETEETGEQVVRYGGGIENSSFSQALFEADVVLKKLGLGLLPTDVWGLKSYFQMTVDAWKSTGKEDGISCRFWFYPVSPTFATPEGVFVIDELQVGVRTEVVGAVVDGKPVKNLAQVRDELGEAFAASLTASYGELAVAYPEVARLKPLYDLVAIAYGMERFSAEDEIRFWTHDYKLPEIKTPTSYELLRREETLRSGNLVRELEIDGGVQLKPLMLDIMDGDATAMREMVLFARPDGNPLVWVVPLKGWEVPGYPKIPNADIDAADHAYSKLLADVPQKKIGCTLTRNLSNPGHSHPDPAFSWNSRTTLPDTQFPSFRSTGSMRSQNPAHDMGGVMLHGVAKILGDARVDLTSGNFSFVVDGENARLSPEVFRKFVTALWAVYYGKQNPGISIDPIAPGVDKHMVRYIGKVINLDIGKVMREADYLMKRWVVGTERPDIPGFMSPEDIAARLGALCLGWNRFWFVPEDMRFKRGGDMLLFDDGRMTLKTESMLKNHGVPADPANLKFAEFFTEHYDEIAERYPVYNELFEYAKLVSLAKYLKEKKVPLYWFLIANKHLVICEDSPGTVDALARGSDHFHGITIEGGVNLEFEGNYVYDKAAVEAINRAMSRIPTYGLSKTSLTSTSNLEKHRTESFSFDLGKDSYTVIPQHSLTSGKDQRGIRYQTDLALRHNEQPGLELVRYYDPKRKDGSEFGNGWHLLIPYRIKAVGDRKRQFLNAIIPEKMALVNLLTGEEEVLTFSTDRYSVAGYVPEELSSSQVIGLFLLSDATYRLADKLGNEFWFDQAGHLTDMILSKEHHVRIEYLGGLTWAVEGDLYRIEAAEDERMAFRNIRIPKAVRIQDRVHDYCENLVFSDKGMVAGYVPVQPEKSRFKILAIMTDGSFRLFDKEDNQIRFDGAGNFNGLVPGNGRCLVKAMSLGEQEVVFSYTVDAAGKLVIGRASLHENDESPLPTYVVRYKYDGEGRLCRVDRSRGPGDSTEELFPRKVAMLTN